MATSDIPLRIEALVPGAQYEGYASNRAEWEDAGDPDAKPLPRPPFIRWKDARPKPTWAALMAVTIAPPTRRDPLAEIDALKARNEKLEAALAAKSVITKAEIDAAVAAAEIKP